MWPLPLALVYRFEQTDSASPIAMTVQLRFPTDLILPASYHIHEKPVNPRDPAGPCSPSSTGGIFAGSDLGTLFENINGPSPYSPGTLYDFSRQLQLNGDTSIVGRAIVIHNGPIPVACATIVGQPRIEAQSTFNSNQVVGFIRCGLTSFRPLPAGRCAPHQRSPSVSRPATSGRAPMQCLVHCCVRMPRQALGHVALHGPAHRLASRARALAMSFGMGSQL